MQLPNGKVGPTARRTWQCRSSNAMLLIHMPLKRISVRILVNAALEIARVSVHPRQRQSKVIVRRVFVRQLQVTRQVDDFRKRLGA